MCGWIEDKHASDIRFCLFLCFMCVIIQINCCRNLCSKHFYVFIVLQNTDETLEESFQLIPNNSSRINSQKNTSIGMGALARI